VTRVSRTSLLVGLPRSGSTFLAGLFSALRPGDRTPGHRRLWERALTRLPRAPHSRLTTQFRVTDLGVRGAGHARPGTGYSLAITA
jgi:hypothetical protein